MRPVLCILIFISLTCCVMTDDLQAQKFARSPEVHDDRTVTFRYFAPKAKTVKLNGNVPQMKGDLIKGKDGVWSITVGPFEPNTYSYKFIVDKAAVMDPVNRKTKAWLWMDNLVDVPANTESGIKPAIHQIQNVPHGTVHVNWYRSQRLKQNRRLFVYTPPGYAKSNRNYPVLYLLHGFGDDESAWTRIGQANHIADNLLAAGKCVPAILVMPFGHDDLPTSPDYDAYELLNNRNLVEQELIEGVIPFIESNYRCKTDLKNRGIAGLSMGGGHALYFGINHLDRFGWIAGFSSSIYRQDVPELTTSKVIELKSSKPWLWLGCGKDDFLYDDTVKFDKLLSENGIQHTTRITEGAHNWRCWRPYLEEVLTVVFK